MWSRLVAGYIRDKGYSVDIIDAEAERLTPEIVADSVVLAGTRLVCIAVYGHQPSASTQQMVDARKIAKAIKKANGDIPIIMVGGHISALPLRTIQEEPIDYACVGEGPVTIHGLLEGLLPNEEIPGLVWMRNPDDFVVNSSAPLLDLSELKGDVWSLLPMDLYKAHNWQVMGKISSRQPYASIYTSLGCTFACSFCCINAPFGSRKYRMRDPKDVVKEVAFLYSEYGVRTIKIIDEMFVLNEKHYTAICEGLIELNIPDLNIWAYARVDTVKAHTLAMFKKAGIQWLALGIESSSKYVRDGAQKRLKNDDIKSVVRSIQAAGINVIGNYIFGLPDDDMDSMKATLELAQDLNTEFANFYSAQAYPGSPLYDEAVAKKWTLPASWRGYSQHNDDCRPLDTRHVSGASVLKFRDEAFTAYFSSPRYLDMVKEKFGQETYEHVRQMTKYHLPRKLLEGMIA
jgi:radical SAM superfamily enzyme YgiQ (UPF0313 family)